MKKNKFDSNDFLFTCVLKALVDNGVDDPDVELWLGVLENDEKLVKAALEKGADVNISDKVIIRRHFDKLTKPPISDRIALGVITVLSMPKEKNTPNNGN